MHERTEARTIALTAAPARLRALALLTVAVLILLASGLARAQAEQNPGIHVSGTGVAYGEPDTAVLDLGVSTVADDVKTAMAQADEVMNAVREAVQAAGVAAEDIVTTGLHVWRDERTDRDGNPTATRFQVRHTYQLTVRDIDSVGDVLAAAVEAGANEVGGITFTLSDPAALAEEARTLALQDARARAESLAAGAGVELGAPVAISEHSPMPFASYRQAAVMAAESSSVATGQLAITVTVQISYAIGDR